MEDERLLKESTEEELLSPMWYFVSLQAVLALLKLNCRKCCCMHCSAADCRSLVTSSNDHQSPSSSSAAGPRPEELCASVLGPPPRRGTNFDRVGDFSLTPRFRIQDIGHRRPRLGSASIFVLNKYFDAAMLFVCVVWESV